MWLNGLMTNAQKAQRSGSGLSEVWPLVSVIMATYNHENFIAEAIEGVLLQNTNFEIELIIGEDCSTDSTRRIIEEYVQKYPDLIRAIYHQSNVGAFQNTNMMFETARGKYVAFCEGDDFWCDPLKLQKQVDYLEVRPDYGFVHSEHNYYVKIYGKWWCVPEYKKLKRVQIYEGNIFDKVIRNMFITHCTVLARRTVLAEHFGSDMRAKLNHAGDWAIAIHASRISKIGYINEPLAVYRRNASSMSSGFKNKLIIRIRTKEIYTNAIRVFGLSEKDRSDLEVVYYKRLLVGAYDAGDINLFLDAKAWLKENAPECLDSKKYWAYAVVLNCPICHGLMNRLRIWLLDLSYIAASLKNCGVKVR